MDNIFDIPVLEHVTEHDPLIWGQMSIMEEDKAETSCFFYCFL